MRYRDHCQQSERGERIPQSQIGDSHTPRAKQVPASGEQRCRQGATGGIEDQERYQRKIGPTRDGVGQSAWQ
jgi:hypothetical protein